LKIKPRLTLRDIVRFWENKGSMPTATERELVQGHNNEWKRYKSLILSTKKKNQILARKKKKQLPPDLRRGGKNAKIIEFIHGR